MITIESSATLTPTLSLREGEGELIPSPPEGERARVRGSASEEAQ